MLVKETVIGQKKDCRNYTSKAKTDAETGDSDVVLHTRVAARFKNSCGRIIRNYTLPLALIILCLDAHILLFGEEPQGFEAAFAAESAVFDAAEWCAKVAEKPTVYPNDAGF